LGAHPNVAVHIDVPTLGFAALTPTYAGALLVIPAQAGIQARGTNACGPMGKMGS